MQSIFSIRILTTAALSAVVAGGILTACQRGPAPDAYGNFETVEVIISADCNGKLLEFNVEEGTRLRRGEIVG